MLRNYVDYLLVEDTSRRVRVKCAIHRHTRTPRVAHAEATVGTGSDSIREFPPQCRSVVGSITD